MDESKSRLPNGPPGACWEWIGAKTDRGYGVLRVGGKITRAHRFAYEVANGPIPGRLHVLHSCDNPACCNPEHLSLGTHDSNMRQMADRLRSSVGERNRGAKLCAEDVRQILDDRISDQDAAQAFGVSVVHIKRLRAGKHWTHLFRCR